MQFSCRGGVNVLGCNLWLDPTRARAAALISHAHSDHVRRHETAIATAPTAALVGHRYGRRMTVRAEPFGRPFACEGATVTLYPAGHVLGSAQILVEHRDLRLLYSGDLRLRPSVAAEPVEVPAADVLIVDSTFGLPRYVFPPEEQVVAAILQFCQAALDQGRTPVLLAYSLGKSQEVILHLARAGFAVAAHPAVAAINSIYREHGVALPECHDLGPGLPAGTVVVAPPQARRGPALQALGPVRTAMLTGWAMDRGASYRLGCDAAFPLSDHCGFDDLLRYVELTGAREVHAVFGFAREFADELRLRGVAAFPAGAPAQLALPGLL